MKAIYERRLNRALDRRVKWGFPCGSRVIPAFQVWAGAGLALAVSAALALANVRGLPLGWMSAAMSASGAACFVFALGYKVVTGEERLVFLQHAFVTIAASAFVLDVAGEPILPYVEILAVCFGVLLAIGRLGCLHAGCCHGRPHPWGVRYGPRHVEEGFSVSLLGVRLVPVQLLESVWSGAAALSCVAALATGAPAGLALACFLPLYALGRFVCELLRGDSGRSWWGPLSEAQWFCVALATFSLAGQWTGVLPSNRISMAIAAVVVALLLGVLAWPNLRQKLQPFHPSDLEAIAGAVHAEAPQSGVEVRSTARGWRFSRGWIEDDHRRCLHWAVSGVPVERLASLARLILRLERLPGDTPVRVSSRHSVTHILAFPADLPEEAR